MHIYISLFSLAVQLACSLAEQEVGHAAGDGAAAVEQLQAALFPGAERPPDDLPISTLNALPMYRCSLPASLCVRLL